MVRISVPVAMVLVGLLLTVGCAQPTPSPTPAPPIATPGLATPAPVGPVATPGLATLTPSPAQARAAAVEQLYEAAKKEGEVVWHIGGFAAKEIQPVIDGFQKRFPGIKLTAVTLNSAAVPPQLITESAARRVSLDVNGGGIDNVGPLVERDLLIRENWAAIFDIAPENIMLDGKVLGLYDLAYGFIYNTKALAAGEVPRSYEDLLLPRFKGRKIGLNRTSGILSSLYYVWPEDRVSSFFQRMKQQEPTIETGGAPAILAKVISGELIVGDNIVSNAILAMERGEPVAISPISPGLAMRKGMYAVKGAPHPNAARLLMGWAASQPARELWEATKRGLATPCGASSLARQMCDAGVEMIAVDTMEKTQSQQQFDEKTMDALDMRPR